MARVVHYRVGVGTPTPTQPTACTNTGFSTPDTDLVTCPWCTDTDTYRTASAEYLTVIDMLAYPKEDHPCLPTHRP